MAVSAGRAAESRSSDALRRARPPSSCTRDVPLPPSWKNRARAFVKVHRMRPHADPPNDVDAPMLPQTERECRIQATAIATRGFPLVARCRASDVRDPQ